MSRFLMKYDRKTDKVSLLGKIMHINKGAKMKVKLISAVAILFLSGVLAFAVYTTGWGTSGTATVTHTQITMTHPVGYLSVYNSGSNIIYALVNVSTSELVTAMVTYSNAIPILPAVTFNFDTQGRSSIDRISIATTNGSALFYMAGF